MRDLLPSWALELLAGLGAALAYCSIALGDGHLTGSEWCDVAVAFLAGAGLAAARPSGPR